MAASLDVPVIVPEHYPAMGPFGAAVLDALEQRIPGIRDKVEMRDVATPATWERYTGNWRGAYEGWLPSGNSLMRQMKKTLPGLDRFHRIGHWTTPGGRQVVQVLCKRDGEAIRRDRAIDPLTRPSACVDTRYRGTPR